MKFSTPTDKFFYFGIDTTVKDGSGDEVFGLGIGRFYCGFYRNCKYDPKIGGFCAGFLNSKGYLD